MKGISATEIELISQLEFDKRYFFTSADVDKITKNKTQRYNFIKNLLKKKRIIKLNKTKYYLIPIKARSGSWAEEDFILVDEILEKDYLIGGWAAAHYYHLTDQIPMRTDVYTTRRQGTYTLLGIRVVFHRTSKEKLKRAVTQRIKNHQFLILNKRKMKQWMKQKE